MIRLFSFGLFFLFIQISSAWAGEIQEIITSTPPGADIYWGKTKAKLQKTGLSTPNTRSIEAKAFESWCYQVKMEGYHDSEVDEMPEGRGDRRVHFVLKRKLVIQETITSDPPNADIYWGKTKDRIKYSGLSTPSTRSIEDEGQGEVFESWCYQVKKKGYLDSKIVCRPDEYNNRVITFTLEQQSPLPFLKTNKASTGEVKNAQANLILLGYKPGPIDGILGKNTRKAIKNFQRDVGVQATGEVDNILFLHLDIAINSIEQADKPSLQISPNNFAHIPLTGQVLPVIPSAISKQPISADKIYQKVKSSIFKVIAGSSLENIQDGIELSHGSAVAVSPHHLLTNSNVINNRPYILLFQGEKIMPAEVVGRNECCDMCVLFVKRHQLIPVGGVRGYDDLSVGEKVYTVGAPGGLEVTLGEGIISSLSKHEDIKWIKTSAPISKGSSGGGLFDSRGNLIGITTRFFSTGQNLYFAISAGQYW